MMNVRRTKVVLSASYYAKDMMGDEGMQRLRAVVALLAHVQGGTKAQDEGGRTLSLESVCTCEVYLGNSN